MAKLTLLEIVQSILNDMDGDEVNSINDTVEAAQIAQIVKTTYYHIIDGEDWPHLNELFQPDASGTVSKPTHLEIPEYVTKLDWLKYNKKTSTLDKDKFEEITYLPPDEFLLILEVRDSTKPNVTVVTDFDGVKLNILNDAQPLYWTSFDDKSIVLDAYDSAVDSTIQNSKTQCYGKIHPSFSLTDSFIPNLPAQAFSYLVAESKAHAFVNLRQTQNAKAEQYSISQRRRMSIDKWKVAGVITYSNYGRK